MCTVEPGYSIHPECTAETSPAHLLVFIYCGLKDIQWSLTNLMFRLDSERVILKSAVNWVGLTRFRWS